MAQTEPEGRAALLPFFLALLAGAGVVASAWAWSITWHGPFQFDDFFAAVGHKNVAGAAGWWAHMPGIRPLLKLSYALQSGEAASAFRAFNTACHILCVVLVWRLAVRAGATSWVWAGAQGKLWAGICALLLAAHPSTIEAVTYVCGRSVVFMALPYLAALLCWDTALQAKTPAQRRAWLSATLALMCTALAVRETAASLPLAFWLWARHVRGLSPAQATQASAAAWAVSLALAALALWLVPGYAKMLIHMVGVRSPFEQLLGQARAWVYLATVSLSGVQPNIDPDVRVGAWDASAALALLLLGAAAASVWAMRRQAPWLVFAALCWALHLLPTNGPLPRNDLANDRHIYLGLAGLCIALAQARPTTLKVVGLAAALAAFTLGNAERQSHFLTEVTLWEATVRSSSEKSRPWNNLGYVQQTMGRCDLAALAYRRAQRLEPDDFKARLNLRFLPEMCALERGKRR